MSVLTSRRTYVGLAAFEAFDATACAIPVRYVVEAIDRLGWPANLRWVLVLLKGGASVGLLSVFRFPGLARLAAAVMTAYFGIGVAAHIRVRSKTAQIVPSALLFVIYAAVAARGPNTD